MSMTDKVRQNSRAPMSAPRTVERSTKSDLVYFRFLLVFVFNVCGGTPSQNAAIIRIAHRTSSHKLSTSKYANRSAIDMTINYMKLHEVSHIL